MTATCACGRDARHRGMCKERWRVAKERAAALGDSVVLCPCGKPSNHPGMCKERWRRRRAMSPAPEKTGDCPCGRPRGHIGMCSARWEVRRLRKHGEKYASRGSESTGVQPDPSPEWRARMNALRDRLMDYWTSSDPNDSEERAVLAEMRAMLKEKGPAQVEPGLGQCSMVVSIAASLPIIAADKTVATSAASGASCIEPSSLTPAPYTARVNEE